MSNAISDGLKRAYKEGRRKPKGFPKGNHYGAISGKKNKGRKRPDMVGNKICSGKILTAGHKDKISKGITGDKHPNWKGGITKESKRLRNTREYQVWRSSVFQRDNWTCQTCGQRGCYLEAHHIKEVSKYKDLMFDVSNGVTLCGECHKLTPNYKGRAR